MREVKYEHLYIQMCFFGAKLSFEGGLMESSGITTMQTGKNTHSLNFLLFSNTKEKIIHRNQSSYSRNGPVCCGNDISCLKISA